MAYNFNTSPYYDDFNADDRFLRILFNPGRAVQARELTQIQSILQNQLQSGANHIWKNGTPVIGGEVSINTREWLQLADVDSTWLNRVVYGETSNAVAIIEQLHDDETQPIYYYRVLSGNFADTENLHTYDTVCDGGFDESGNCADNSWYDATQAYKAGVITAKGQGLEAKVGNGIYWLDGFFTPVLEQTIFLSPTSPTPTTKVGFDIGENIIESTTDPRLLDPASGFYNQNAPGADRYQIALTLVKEEDSAESNKWIWLMDISEGKITTTFESTTYSLLANELAQRTYDESGNYTLNPFPLEMKESADSSKFIIKVEPSKAYINGHSHELLVPTELESNRARTSRHVANDHITPEFGPYFEIESVNDLHGVFNVVNKEYVNFVTDENYTSAIANPTTVGQKQRITHVTKEDTSFRIYVENDDGLDAISPARYIVSESDPDVYAKLYRPTGVATRNGVNYPWIYKMTDIVSSVTLGQVTFSTQKNFSATLTSDTASVPAVFNDMHWERVLYIFDDTTGSIIPKSGTVASGDMWTADLSGNTNAIINIVDQDGNVSTNLSGHHISIMADMYMSNAQWRSIGQDAAASGDFILSDEVLTLPHGVTKIVSVIAPDTTNVTNSFTFLYGETDTTYGNATLTWTDTVNASQPGTYTVTYEVYNFGNITTANYFAVNSYTDAGLSYEIIPAYRGNVNQEIFSLADTLDFRTSEDDYAVGTYLPLPSSNISVSYDYYLPRKDRLVIDDDGIISIKEGFPSDDPILPTEEPNEMTLYTMFVPAYTFEHKNVNVTHVKNKRYTMQDIRGIENRLDKLEYYTALNLLEQETAAMQVIDENGLMRYKNGMLVDPFVDHGIGDINDEEYYVSIYPEAGICTTPFEMSGLDFEGGVVSGMRKNNITYTLDFDIIESWISQPYGSQVINLNPYARKSWVGFVTLTPSTDTWFEEEYMPDVIIQNENNNAVLQQVETYGTQTRWGNWQTTWSGWRDTGGRFGVTSGAEQTFGGWGGSGIARRVFNGSIGRLGLQSGGISRQVSVWRTIVNRERWQQAQQQQSSQVRTGERSWMETNDIRTEVGDRLVDTSAIPWMRSIPITVEADKLRPNTVIHFKFDGVDVDAYMTPEGGSMGDAVSTDSMGRLRNTIFTVPSEGSDGVRFRTGTKILDMKDSYESDMTTQAIAPFTSAGTLHTRQKDILSTLESYTVTESIRDDRSILGPRRTVSRSRVINSSTSRMNVSLWYDPVAESFLVNDMEGGVFIDSIDLYFWSKDDESTPVRVELRTMENGYPTASEIPLASSMLYPEDVVTASNGTANTRFTFADPIYLMNGTEYCFVVISDSLKYNLFISELGETDLATGEYISSQPYLGSMFTSQNNTTWTAEQNKDVKFRINRCDFDTGSEGTIQLNMKGFDGTKKITSFTPNFQPMVLTGTDFTLEGIINGNTNNTITGILDNENEFLEQQETIDGSHTIEGGYQYTPISYIATVSSENSNISPVINTERMGTIIQNNVVFDNATEEKNQKGVYLSKDIKLSNPAMDLVMWLSIQAVPNTYIKVFYDTGKVIPRYITTKSYTNTITHGDYNVNDFEEEYAYVYPAGTNSPENTITNNGQGIASWTGVIGSTPASTHVSTAYVDGDDNPDNTTMMHIADISNMKSIVKSCFISRYDLDTVTADVTSAGIGTDISNYEVGDIWFGIWDNDLDRKFYRKILMADGSMSKEEVPVLEIDSEVPEEHPDFGINLAVIEEDAVTWREMKDSGTGITNSSIVTDMEFVEHTFSPLKKIVDEFDHFRVKIELHTTNPVYLPAVRELRVMAVT